MSKHTPGPWQIDGEYVYQLVSAVGNGVSIFESEWFGCITGTPEEALANARLIVAAPEMYELIAHVAAATESGYGSMMSAAQLAETLLQLRKQAKQLMAKIEGGEQ
jgi:hypothetical protein